MHAVDMQLLAFMIYFTALLRLLVPIGSKFKHENSVLTLKKNPSQVKVHSQAFSIVFNNITQSSSAK